VLVQVSASPICLRYLDLKSRGRLLFKRGGWWGHNSHM
jgi:hypothetical protein